jgi:regulatory protein
MAGRRGRGPRARDGAERRPADDPPRDPAELAREIVLQQLSYSARTRSQLLTALRRRGIEDEVAEAVLDRYAELDLVDDEAFAEQWVSTRHATKGLSKRALAYELRRKGVEDEVVRSAVGTVTPDDELEAARRLVRSRLGSVRDPDPARRARRLAGILARKGYGAGLAWSAVRDVLGEGVPDDVETGIDDDPLDPLGGD